MEYDGDLINCEKCNQVHPPGRGFCRVDENVSLRPDIIEIFILYSENKFMIEKDSIEEALLNSWVQILYHIPEDDPGVFTAADKLTELWHKLNLRLPKERL